MNYPDNMHAGAQNLKQKLTLVLSQRHLSTMRSVSGDWYIGSLALYLLCVAIVLILVASPSLFDPVK